MRIISRFHDFYDGVATHGVDRSVVFLREQRSLTEQESALFLCELPPTQDSLTYGARGVALHAWPFWVAVAGLRYHGMAVRRSGPPWLPDEYFYSSAEYRAHGERVTGINPLAPARYRRRHNWKDRSLQRIAQWLDQPSADVAQVMADKGFAILAYTGRWIEGPPRRREPIIVNARLADFDFFKARDPYQVFQDLSAWVGGVLPGREAMRAEVSDADRFIERGFDAVTSFRGKNR